MIVIHGASIEGNLYLWGERGASPVSLETGSRKKRKDSPPLESPYAASPDEIRKSLLSGNLLSIPEKTPSHALTAYLPSRASPRPMPIPSSSLIDSAESEASDAGASAILPWKIAALRLSVEDAIELLGKCEERRLLARGILAAPDLSFWGRCLQFTGSLVMRQRYVPGAQEIEKGFRAIWEPVIQGEDQETMARLADLMPPSCLALTDDEREPGEIPLSALKRFVDLHLDGMVRAGVNYGAPVRSKRAKQPSFASMHDAWLHALGEYDGEIQCEKKELVSLLGSMESWKKPLTCIVSSPYRLCLRLEEPAEEEEEWYVRYLLQSAGDLSLILEVGDLWGKKGDAAHHLKKEGFGSRDYLVSALGEISELSPAIERSLMTHDPSGFSLSTEGAYAFLTETAPILDEKGFPVMLPRWWTMGGSKLSLQAKARASAPKMKTKGTLFESIVQFDWEIALGDETLSKEELERLARLKVPLVRLRGQWMEMRGEDIKAALDLLEKKALKSGTLRDVLTLSLGGEGRIGSLGFGGMKAEGWIAELLEQLREESAFTELPPPGGFTGTLRPYQVRGYSWLAFLRKWGLGACLADDMGLGKTVQALAFLLRERERDGKKPVLLICPTSVASHWKKEAERFSPTLPVMVHHGVGRAKGEAFLDEVQAHALVVSTYSLLHRDIEHLKEVDWAGIIVDEAQNIKNPETQTAKAGRALTADFRIALTGTPVENSLGDLWSLMEFLNPGFLGSQADFKKRFFIPIQVLRNAEAAERLKRLTAPFILRRLKTDKSIIDDLPEKIEMKEYCTLTREQATLYSAALKELDEEIAESEGIERKGKILGLISRLKQICNHPAQFLKDNLILEGRSGKLARLSEMLEETLSVDDRSLIFTQFAEMGALLKRYLEENFGEEALFLHGGVSKPKRDEMVSRFQEEAKAPHIFILSVKAGGTGLNLTKANHVFHFDRWWNPAVENQATDRAFRIGQKKNVEVHKFICAGTFEERIDELIESKKDLAENIVGAGEGWITELSNKELKNIFALRKSALTT